MSNLDTPVSLNRYTYANNNPLDFMDPDGRCAVRYDGMVCSSSYGARQRAKQKAREYASYVCEVSCYGHTRARLPWAYTSPNSPSPRSTTGSSSVSCDVNCYGHTRAVTGPKFASVVVKPTPPSPQEIAVEQAIAALAEEASVDFTMMRDGLACVHTDECGGQNLIDALTTLKDTEYGQLLFGTIDVANQQDWDTSNSVAAGTTSAGFWVEGFNQLPIVQMPADHPSAPFLAGD